MRLVPFGITRHDEPIERVSLSNTVQTGINFRASYEHWSAAIATGATLDELLKWENGEYPKWFMARVIAFYRGTKLIEGNKEDAVAREIKKRSKKKK